MDEAFDMWRVAKTAHDYHLDFDEWGERDLADMVLRDRNHPAVILWSIGNEIMEQWERQDSSSMILTRKLAAIVRNLDDTRPVTSACNGADPDNPLIRSGALDVIGFNYHIENYADFPQKFPGQKLVASETESALATRGSYDMPSDSIRRWPVRWDIPFTTGNPDYTCSSYDNCSAPWGSTHEETWREARKYEFVSGVFTWTGFDYLGEPTPYDWPARSSYFGIIDLAGFPKDAYYLMQSLWTDEPVLHLFPHWNWENDQIVDVWAYTNLEEVELFLNGTSQGVRKITADSMHAMWRLQYTPGTLRAVGRRNGTVILTKEVKTAGEPAKIMLETDRDQISADGMDLAFLTARIVDRAGVLVPHADNMINFSIRGDGKIAGVDNGLQTSHEPFQADHHKAFNGLCLAVIRAGKTPGAITVGAASGDLEPAVLTIKTQ